MWWSSCCGLVVVLLCLINVAQIKAQCQRPSIDGNRVLAEGTYEEGYENGATLTLKCATGYVTVNPSASRTITCLGSMWSTPELQCKKRSCGSPGEITNGEYLLSSGVEFGSTATVKCNIGYQLAGQITTRRCLDTGIWDGHPPKCEAVRCPKPPPIENGQIDSNHNVYIYNQAVTYSCVGGTFLFGAKTLTCSADGTFKPDPPQCTSVRCPAFRLTNGFRTGGKYAQTYELREFLEFKCDPGYVMEGSDRIVCQQNGWEPPPPTCRSIPPPTHPPTLPPNHPSTTTRPDLRPGPDPGPAKLSPGIIGGIVVGVLVVLGVIGGVIYKTISSGNGSFGKVATRNEERDL